MDSKLLERLPCEQGPAAMEAGAARVVVLRQSVGVSN